MKIYIITYVAYGDRTKTVQVFDKFFYTRKSAEETAKLLRACGHAAVKIVPLVQEWRLRYWRDKRKNALNQYNS